MSRRFTQWMLAAMCGSLSWLMPFSASAQHAVTLKAVDSGMAVMIGGEEFTVLRHSPDLPKPFFSPVHAPGGAMNLAGPSAAEKRTTYDPRPAAPDCTW